MDILQKGSCPYAPLDEALRYVCISEILLGISNVSRMTDMACVLYICAHQCMIFFLLIYSYQFFLL